MRKFWKYWKKPDTLHEGREAKVEAEAALEQAKAQRKSVEVVSTSLREHRGRNHYADSITALIQGG